MSYEKKMVFLVADMPMTKWSGSAKENLVVFDGKDAFSVNLTPAVGELKLLYSWTEEIAAEYRLHAYLERKAKSLISHSMSKRFSTY